MEGIKAGDLRIGNFVRRIGLDEIRRVTEIRLEEIDHVHYAIPDEEFGLWDSDPCEGIPLTEDLLKRFGFVSKWNDGGKQVLRTEWKIKGFTMYFHTRGSDKKTACIWHGVGFDSDVKIRYVHQLQNLYYALNGNELTLTTNP